MTCVSALKRRKKGREYVQAIPSRFIAEMKLSEGGGPKEDPREKLRRQREELAAKAKAAADAAKVKSDETSARAEGAIGGLTDPVVCELVVLARLAPLVPRRSALPARR